RARRASGQSCMTTSFVRLVSRQRRVAGFRDVHGDAHVTWFGPGPDNCTALTAERVLTLDSDGSTPHLSLEGVLCQKGNSGGRATPVGSGIFTITGGTGQFTGASGAGQITVEATGEPGLTDTSHYEGTLTLTYTEYHQSGLLHRDERHGRRLVPA